jgi:methionyl-tRNA formyltransferase
MKLLFAGTPEFAAIALAALLDAGHEIALVLTQPDRAAGRGLKPQPSAVKLLAQARGLSIQQPTALDGAVVAAVSAARPDAMIVAAYGLIVPPALLDLPARGCLNVHASLLPRWRGAAPIQRALMAGDARTGITIMQMDAGLDTGPMLLQEALTIAADETAGSLHDKPAALGAAYRARSPRNPSRSRGTRAARPYARSCKEGRRRSTGAARRKKSSGKSAPDPVPGAQTRLAGGVVKIRHARRAGNAGVPGTVCASEPAGILVACGRDGLRVTELQRAGGRRLAAGEFLAGFRAAAGGFTLAPGSRLGTGNG